MKVEPYWRKVKKIMQISLGLFIVHFFISHLLLDCVHRLFFHITLIVRLYFHWLVFYSYIDISSSPMSSLLFKDGVFHLSFIWFLFNGFNPCLLHFTVLMCVFFFFSMFHHLYFFSQWLHLFLPPFYFFVVHVGFNLCSKVSTFLLSSLLF